MSEITEEYLEKARLVVSSAHPQENLAHVIARALMEAEARGEARGMEKALDGCHVEMSVDAYEALGCLPMAADGKPHLFTRGLKRGIIIRSATAIRALGEKG